ncbi:MAG: Trm112 family protein [Chloroflexota bacterium]|nr:Trm112 family protein [Chloroflexota bacterium]
MASSELLDILRCPACVSGPDRREGPDPGRLKLVQGKWLVCQEPGCDRKYPIRDGIPVMLIEEGDKYRDVPVEELPDPGSL